MTGNPATAENLPRIPHREGTETEDEYTVESILAHHEIPTGMWYKVWWYGYTLKDDTWELEHSLPSSSIFRYQQRISRGREKP